ncbi:MAG: efflux RND transporter permease subunit, partial [Candidatus Cryptobacteroides sp.]
MEKKGGQFIRGAITYKKIVYFITALLVGVGIYGISYINKDEFPTFEIKEGLVVGVYPGASASEVEQQLTKPLEELLFGFSEVSRATFSQSKDGMCFIYVMLNSPASKKDEVWSKLKHSLNTYKPQLPPGVLAVAVMEDFSSISTVLLALESQDKGYVEMQAYADELCSRLRELPQLANAKVYGGRGEEIAVTVDRERMASYGINPTMLTLGFQTAGLQVMSGQFSTGYADSPIHINGLLSGEQEIAERIVYSDIQGNVVRLKDIATVERRLAAPSSEVRFNGKSALLISIEMRPENDIVAFGKLVDGILNEFSSVYSPSEFFTAFSIASRSSAI